MEQKKARVHSFETFGAVDGPGIRFVIFMQGCNLKCKYCHNRDTWNINAGMEYTSDELIAKISRYKNYFSVSGGGVTVSRWRTTFTITIFNRIFRQVEST